MTLRDPSAYSTVLNFVNTGFKWSESRKGSAYWDSVRTALIRLVSDQKICYGTGRDKPMLESFDQARAALLAAFNWDSNKPGSEFWAEVYDALGIEKGNFRHCATDEAESSDGDALEKLIGFISYGFMWSQSKHGVAYWSSVSSKLRYNSPRAIVPVNPFSQQLTVDKRQQFADARRWLSGAFVWRNTPPGHTFWGTVGERLLDEGEHFKDIDRAAPIGLNPPGGHLKAVIDDSVNVSRDLPDVLLSAVIESDTGLKGVTDLAKIAATLNFRVARLIRDEQAPTRPDHDNIETFEKRLVAAFSALAVYADVAGVDLIEAVCEDMRS